MDDNPQIVHQPRNANPIIQAQAPREQPPQNPNPFQNQNPLPPLHQNITVRLDNTNHLLWQTQMMNIIIANGLEDHIDGSTPSPPQFLDDQQQQQNPEYTHWRRLDRLVMSWIYLSLTEGMMGRIVGLTTAQETWDSLNQVYQTASISTILNLKTQLMNTKKDGLTITEYLDRLKTIFDKFVAIGEPLSYRDKLIHTFRGLGPDYNAIVSSLSARPNRPSMDEIHNLLINHEYRLEEQQAVDHLNLVQAQFAQMNLTHFSKNNNSPKSYSSNFPNNFKPQHSFFNNQSRFTNFSQNKHQNIPQSPFHNPSTGILGKPNFPPFSNPTYKPNNKLRTVCQICHKIGHAADVCYHRGDSNYQPQPLHSGFNRGNTSRASFRQPYQPNAFTAMLGTSSHSSAGSTSESPWFLDSGATHHFTPDLSSLDNPLPFLGDDQVMVGNGSLLEENPSAGKS